MLVDKYGRWYMNTISLAYTIWQFFSLVSKHFQDPHGQIPVESIAKHLNIFIIQLLTTCWSLFSLVTFLKLKSIPTHCNANLNQDV